jgi:S-DNA-T family DNA segregation ATPase FtsK/SpoIIIE
MSEHERCAACGFDGSSYDNAALLATLRDLGPRWRALLGSAGDELRARPAPAVWSAIEYAAHSRDITALHVFGVEQALTGDEPVFPAIADDLIDNAAAGYVAEAVETMLDALEMHARQLATLADDAGAAAWSRGITLGDQRSEARWLMEHALHDSLHHLDDVERGFAQLRTQS